MTAALERGEQAVAAARRLGYERLLIPSLASLCGYYYLAGQPEKGLPLGEESVERARQLGDDVLLGASLLGFLLSADLIDPVPSGQLFAEAIACTERSGDQLIAYLLRNNVGVHALRAGTCPRPGLTWNTRRELHGRSVRKASMCRSTWAGCCARRATRTARGPCSRRPCGSAAATGTAQTWLTPASGPG
jgi:hypothetical protein